MRELNVFVAPDGNAFMSDIASWIVEAGRVTGRGCRLVDDGSSPHDAMAINLVVAPHEFYLLSDFDDATIHTAAQVSVPVCTEQPGTPWFEIGLVTARSSRMALDINAHGVEALQAAGVQAHHLRLGGVPSMSVAANDEPRGARDTDRDTDRDIDREIDVVFLGGKTDRRAARLAEMAPLLWNRETDLRMFSFTRPVSRDEPGLVFGADKYALLARSHILLNIHRDDTEPGYFEWARMVEAMANGCCILTEPVTDFAPFVDGEHFIASDDLGRDLAELLDDPDRCRTIGEAARTAVLDSFPMAGSLAPVLRLLDESAPPIVASKRIPRYRRQLIVAQQHPLLPAFRPNQDLRARLYRALVAETELQRRVERARSLLRHGVDDHVEVIRSDAYDTTSPQVSVVVTLYNYGHLVVETLASIAASTGTVIEVIVVDDHSTDDGRAVVGSFLEAHPDVAMLLLGSDINRGLPAARNLGFEHARADRVMVMDADNLVYPNAIARLSQALDADPGAAFAYSTLEEFGVTAGVRSAMAWNVERLCESNYIDAQAMIRLDAWARHGGYRTDDELVFGWEDWELWLRLAAASERGAHVAQMLGRYRTQAESMISITNLVADEMIEHLHQLHPQLPWPSG